MGQPDVFYAFECGTIDTSQLLLLHQFSTGSGLCEICKLSNDEVMS